MGRRWRAFRAAMRAARRTYRRERGRERLAYDTAEDTRRTEGWSRPETSANAEIYGAAGNLRAAAHELARNNQWASSALSVLTSNLVGEGIQGRARIDAGVRAELDGTRLDGPALEELVDSLWLDWVGEADATGVLDLDGMQALAARAMFESGEVFVRRRARRTSDGLTVPLQLELLEADFCDHLRDGTTDSGNPVTQGVEHDYRGARVAYWLFEAHPGDTSSWTVPGYSSKRLPAWQIAHLFEPQRPGQVRGVPWLAPVMQALRDFGDYEDAELLRRKFEACLVGTSYGTEDWGQSGDEQGAVVIPVRDSHGDKIETLEPGLIHHAAPGQRLEITAPASVGGVAEYRRSALTAIAAGLRLCYTLLTGDLTGANFSTIRAGLIEFRRMIRSIRKGLFLRMFLDPVWSWFVAAAQGARRLPVLDLDGAVISYGTRWSPPMFESVDREKDARADLAELQNRTASLSSIIAGRGSVVEDVLDDIARDEQALRGLGISAPWMSSSSSPAPADEEQDA